MLIAALALAAEICPATPPPLPPVLAGWRQSGGSILAAHRADDRRADPLPIGRRVEVKLLSEQSVEYDAPPNGKAPGREGGVLIVAVPTPGRYRIVLSAAAWIDLVGAGNAIASVGHGHGPDCSGIRKMVDFDLQAGRYTLQLSGAQAGTIGVMVTAAQGGESH